MWQGVCNGEMGVSAVGWAKRRGRGAWDGK